MKKFKNNKLLLPVLSILIVALFVALPQLTESKPYVVILMKTIFMSIALTLSWALFSGTTGYTCLATAAFYCTGLYTAAMLGDVLPLPLMVLCGGLISSF